MRSKRPPTFVRAVIGALIATLLMSVAVIRPASAAIIRPGFDTKVSVSSTAKVYTTGYAIIDHDPPSCNGHLTQAYIKWYLGAVTSTSAYVQKVEMHIITTAIISPWT